MGSIKPALSVEGQLYYRESDVARELAKRELRQVHTPRTVGRTAALDAVFVQAVEPAMAKYHDADGIGDVYFTHGGVRYVHQEAVALLEMETHERMGLINSGPGFYIENGRNEYVDDTTFRLEPTRRRPTPRRRPAPSPAASDELTRRTAPTTPEEKSADLNKLFNDIMSLTKGTPPERNYATQLQAVSATDWGRNSLSHRVHRRGF